MRRLLVTGGAGFIGSNFVHYWLSQYAQDRVVVFDALTYAGNRANLSSVEQHVNFRFVHGDICDYERVLALLQEEAIDTLVHFAAESHVDRSISGPDAFIQTNIVGTHALLKAAKVMWLDGRASPAPHRFHHVSTDEVYGSLSQTDPAFSESTAYSPNSPYAASKAASDHLVRAYHETFKLNTTMSNCSNNYGPYHFPEKLIPLTIVNILHGQAIPIYGDGMNIRDWLYVEDHCRGIDLVLNKGLVGETYNIGGNNEWANINIVKRVCSLLDQAFLADVSLAQKFPKSPMAKGSSAATLMTFVKDRLGHDRRYAVDASKINRELGYVPVESFDTGIEKTVAWYLTNTQWWSVLLERNKLPPA